MHFLCWTLFRRDNPCLWRCTRIFSECREQSYVWEWTNMPTKIEFSHIFSECRKQSLVWEWKTMQKKNSHRFSLVTEHVICLDTTQRIHIFYSLLSCCWTPDPGLTLRSFIGASNRNRVLCDTLVFTYIYIFLPLLLLDWHSVFFISLSRQNSSLISHIHTHCNYTSLLYSWWKNVWSDT